MWMWLLGCTTGAAEPPEPVEAVADAAVVVEPFGSGRILLPVRAPGEAPVAEHRVVDSPAAYEALIASLPTESIQKTQPAPPSDDPLLQAPPVDFTRHVLLVAVRDDMYVGPVIRSVVDAPSGERVVTVDLPDPGEMAFAARRADVGTYTAVRVPKGAGAVRWVTAPTH